MAITTLDGLLAGLIASPRLPLQRASLSTMVAGSEGSLWRGTGFPAQGNTPSTAAICNAATTGALPLATRAGDQDRLLGLVALMAAAAGHTILFEDRLMHMGGLSGTVTTAQTVGVSLYDNLANSNLAARIGLSNYSEVEWYLEWYTATGSTAATPTAAVTYHDGTTGTVNAWVAGGTALPVSVAASRRYKLSPTNGKYIRSVETVTLSASTGTAGSFGVTAVRRLAQCCCAIANQLQVFDWSQLGAPKIEDNACLTMGQMCITTSTGALAGFISQAVA